MEDKHSAGPAPRLSIVLVAYQMARELPRTLKTLTAAYQQMARDEYEVIVVDNGSTPAVSSADFGGWGMQLRVLRMDNPTHSPVPAMNRGLQAARGELVGAFIDGARMLSPGVLTNALRASRLAEKPVIATMGFHLGPDAQMRSVPMGYNQATEDALLDAIPWSADGHRLFEIASFSGSSSGGWFAALQESNGLFLKKESWQALGGFDPGFTSPGGGLANLDLYRRACELEGSQLIVLLGEGTFHQVHGGIATNRPNPPHAEFQEEYVRLRGGPYTPPSATPIYLGGVPAPALPSIEYSAGLQRERGAPQGVLTRTPNHRPFAVSISPFLLDTVQKGVMRSEYRGVPCLKSPFDLVLYSHLIDRLKPRTVIEIGGKNGGSALWFADRLNLDRPGARVVSVDIEPDVAFKDSRIDVIRGDALHLSMALPESYLETLERPWLLVEDSAHTEEITRAVLEFFGPRLRTGEYAVVEDGVVSSLPGDEYRWYKEGPNRAVAGYQNEHPGVFEIDTGLCDFYGFNVTYNPNGWLRRL